MTSWILGTLIGLPIAGGVGAIFIKKDALRTFLISFVALAVTICGIALVWQTAGEVWDFHGGENWLLAGGAAEILIILIILGVACKIRNAWIIIFSILQLAFAVGIHFIHGHTSKIAEVPAIFRIDDLTRIMLLVSCCVGSAILIFSIGYMKSHQKHVPPTAGSLGRFYFFFLSFLGFMVGLVVSNNLSFFSFFWEATTICSYALIGQDGGEARKVNATRALFINSFGGVLLLAGVFLLKWQTDGESFDHLFSNHAATNLTLLAAILLCIAAFTKSALFPFQSWLLGAMVAPTPVSGMLHAATMVKAGVYLVMRITPQFIVDNRVMMVVAFAGALSFVGGALLACTQSNAKRVLAYSTISNLGLVVACAGIDTPLAYAAGLSIISFHAISKGLLFLSVGRIEHKIGSRDIEDMDGLLYKMPYTTVIILLGMMTMLLPPFGMLLSKWLAIEATMRSPFLLVFMVLGSALTVFFWAKWIGRIQHSGYHEFLLKEDISFSMKFSLGALAVLVLASGLFTMSVFRNVFIPMSHVVFGSDMTREWKLLNEASNFSSIVIFVGVGTMLLFYYFVIWRVFKKKWVRLPFLCGVNISKEERDQHAKSYDFHSVGGKIEHSHVMSYYFHGIINEKITTTCLCWAAWMIIIVLVGNAVASMSFK